QHRATTPRPVWNPDVPATERFREQWQLVPDNEEYDNGFKVQWEQFLGHVARGEPYPLDLWAGARGVQLAEAGLRSAREGRRCGHSGGTSTRRPRATGPCPTWSPGAW